MLAQAGQGPLGHAVSESTCIANAEKKGGNGGAAIDLLDALGERLSTATPGPLAGELTVGAAGQTFAATN